MCFLDFWKKIHVVLESDLQGCKGAVIFSQRSCNHWGYRAEPYPGRHRRTVHAEIATATFGVSCYFFLTKSFGGEENGAEKLQPVFFEAHRSRAAFIPWESVFTTYFSAFFVRASFVQKNFFMIFFGLEDFLSHISNEGKKRFAERAGRSVLCFI